MMEGNQGACDESRNPLDSKGNLPGNHHPSVGAQVSYLNSNGLVDGNIPAGSACPFIGNCQMKNERCPSEEKVKPHTFSCALARLNSMIKKSDSEGVNLPLLKKVRDNLGK
jgi:hypothetical protein